MNQEAQTKTPVTPEERKLTLNCPTCGSPLANIRTGAICLKGHGGIYPKVDSITDARATGIDIPVATPTAFMHLKLETSEDGEHRIIDKAIYTIAGKHGIFSRVARLHNRTEPSVKDGMIASVDRDGKPPLLREFIRSNSIELMLEAAGFHLQTDADC